MWGGSYFNYTPLMATSWLERRSFVRQWWRIYAGDRRWAPPEFQAFDRQVRSLHRHLHQAAWLLWIEALPGSPHTPTDGMMVQRPTAAFEETVAAAILRLNPEQPAVAELALLRVVNNEEALERLLHFAWEQVVYAGCERIVGPTGILPGWQDGLLLNAFDRTPPLHTPYNPPYAPDLMAAVMEPWAETMLWELPVPVADPANLPPAPTDVSIEPIPLTMLAVEHAPLWQALWPGVPGLHTPSADDLLGLAQELEGWPTAVWLARAGEEAVGFVALQPDGAELLRTTGGGRSLLSRLWLHGRRSRVRCRAGRAVAGGVLPGWRGRGIGSQLWLRSLAWARRHGWAAMTAGPAPALHDAGQGAALPSAWQARPLRHYQSFQWAP